MTEPELNVFADLVVRGAPYQVINTFSNLRSEKRNRVSTNNSIAIMQ